MEKKINGWLSDEFGRFSGVFRSSKFVKLVVGSLKVREGFRLVGRACLLVKFLGVVLCVLEIL